MWIEVQLSKLIPILKLAQLMVQYLHSRVNTKIPHSIFAKSTNYAKMMKFSQKFCEISLFKKIWVHFLMIFLKLFPRNTKTNFRESFKFFCANHIQLHKFLFINWIGNIRNLCDFSIFPKTCGIYSNFRSCRIFIKLFAFQGFDLIFLIFQGC